MNFSFFQIREKNDRKRIKNVFIVNLKISKRHLHFLWALLIPRTQKHGYRHQNRDSSYARAQVIAKHVISMVGHFECVIERG